MVSLQKKRKKGAGSGGKDEKGKRGSRPLDVGNLKKERNVDRGNSNRGGGKRSSKGGVDKGWVSGPSRLTLQAGGVGTGEILDRSESSIKGGERREKKTQKTKPGKTANPFHRGSGGSGVKFRHVKETLLKRPYTRKMGRGG